MKEPKELNPADVYADKIKLAGQPKSAADKERNSAGVIKGAALGLEEALGDLLGNLGQEADKDRKK